MWVLVGKEHCLLQHLPSEDWKEAPSEDQDQSPSEVKVTIGVLVRVGGDWCVGEWLIVLLHFSPYRQIGERAPLYWEP